MTSDRLCGNLLLYHVDPCEAIMSLTRAFKSGNSQAVRIPAELAYEDMNVDLKISRMGDVIVISPARPSMKETVAKLRAMPRPPEIGEREAIEMPDRDWD